MKKTNKKTTNKNKIYFVRHAETYSNTGEKFEKDQIVRITENGHKQAKKVVTKIVKPVKFYASLYFRTLETAQYSMRKHKDVEMHILPHVHEFSYLEHDETINERLHLPNEEKFKRVYEYWKKLDPHFRDGKGAETFKEFVNRLIETRKFLLSKNHDGNVYIFTHGNFSRGFKMLHTEFRHLLDKKISKKDLKEFMKRFHESYEEEEYRFKNTQVIDVTDMI